jgi:hypothetical protein
MRWNIASLNISPEMPALEAIRANFLLWDLEIYRTRALPRRQARLTSKALRNPLA